MAAGFAGEKAVTLGLKRQPWVKASLAPGSKVVSDYLAKAKLTPYLDELGFNLVGYGCTTCIGNSGPLPDPIETAIKKSDLTVGAVLSGNRNFEGRIHPLVKTNWLASPPLVVAYALAGNMNINLASEPIGHDRKGDPVYLKDIWPSAQEIARAVEQVSTEMFRKEYAEVFEGTAEWKGINVTRSDTYGWQEDSTYIRLSPFFDEMQATPAPVEDIHGARILAMLVEQNRFSRQLYYALHAFEITIPPLRMRRGSIPALVNNKLRSLEKRFSTRLKIDDDALARLVSCAWPGNDFELYSVIENLALSSDNGRIRVSDLPEHLFTEQATDDVSATRLSTSLSFAEVEKEAIINAAQVTGGRIQEMSALLGIGRTTLWRKMKQHGIDAGQFKRRV